MSTQQHPPTPSPSPSLDDPIFAAFARQDQYGTMGQAPQPLAEYLRLVFFTVFLAPLKVIGAFSALVGFWAICQASVILPNNYRMRIVARLGQLYCRACLFALGFPYITHQYIEPPDYPTDAHTQPAGIVSNHAGYTDILVAMWLFFPSFVARKSTRYIPFVGIISYMMGCLYVDRELAAKNGGAGGLAGKVKERMEGIADGSLTGNVRPMLLFPEGTTTNNRYMLPFRTGAFLAGVPLKPIILLYSKEEPLSMSWESIPIQRHLFLALANPIHRLTVLEFPVYVPSAAEKADPKLFAANVRALMIKYGGFQPSHATFADKQHYLAMLGVQQDVKTLPPAPTHHVKSQ